MSAEPPTAEPPPAASPPPTKPNPLDAIVARLNRWHALFAIVALSITAVAQVVTLVEQQWQIVLFTLIISLAAAALFTLSDRRCKMVGSRWSRFTSRASIAILLLIAPVTLGVFILVTNGQRFGEHPPIIAIARFDGPKLPEPYNDCRPSDMLTDTLSDVNERYHQLTAFELPYVIDPNGRWAQWIAQAHGFLQGADIVVYGEYSLVDSAPNSNKADRILISPSVDSVPPTLLSLGRKAAPLAEWHFPTRTVNIEQLCTGTSERFLFDARRLALALSGLRLFAHQEYKGAAAALHDAESTDAGVLRDVTISPELRSDERDAACDAGEDSDVMLGSDVSAIHRSKCAGVLAFYLAVLNSRMGKTDRAEREFAFAAAKLHAAPPFINLGELYMSRSDGARALDAFRSALLAEPHSVSALAALSQCEYEYSDQAAAAVHLKRALAEYDEASKFTLDPWRWFAPGLSGYDVVTLSRVLYSRIPRTPEDRALKQRGFDMMAQFIRSKQHRQLQADAKIDFGRWLEAEALAENKQAALTKGTPQEQEHRARASRLVDEAIAMFDAVIEQRPGHIKANYELGEAVRAKLRYAPQLSAADLSAAVELADAADVTALTAQPFTDDDYVDQGNAAFELVRYPTAICAYDRALRVNDRSVYAYANRGKLYEAANDPSNAAKDVARAVALHPREDELREHAKSLLSGTSFDAGRVAGVHSRFACRPDPVSMAPASTAFQTR